MSEPRMLRCRKGTLSARELGEVARHLRSGGLLAYPTETVYGLGGLVRDEPLRALAAFKRRETSKPFIVLLPHSGAAPGLTWNPCAQRLAEHLWPGPLTLVLPDPKRAFPAQVRGRSGGVAVRVSPAPIVEQILGDIGAPVTSTSANPPGGKPALSGAQTWDAVRALGADGRLWVIDAGEIPPAMTSTIVDCTGVGAVVLRAGAISASLVREICPQAGETEQ